jgi:predicted nuclease with TOPRIM domain
MTHEIERLRAEIEAAHHERDSLQDMWRRSQDENTKLRDEVDRLQAGIRRAWLALADEHESEALIALIPADFVFDFTREDGSCLECRRSADGGHKLSCSAWYHAEHDPRPTRYRR